MLYTILKFYKSIRLLTQNFLIFEQVNVYLTFCLFYINHFLSLVYFTFQFLFFLFIQFSSLCILYDQKVFGCYFLPFNFEELPWKYQKINKGFCLLCPKQEGNGHLFELASYTHTHPPNIAKILLANICEKLGEKKKKKKFYVQLVNGYLSKVHICHLSICNCQGSTQILLIVVT